MTPQLRRNVLCTVTGVVGALAGCSTLISDESPTRPSSTDSPSPSATEGAEQTPTPTTESTVTFSDAAVRALEVDNTASTTVSAEITVIDQSGSDTTVFDRTVTLEPGKGREFNDVLQRRVDYHVEVQFNGHNVEKDVRTGGSQCEGIDIYFESASEVSILVICR